MGNFEKQEKNEIDLWHKFESIDPDNYHFEGIDKSLLTKEDFQIIDEFVGLMHQDEVDFSKVSLDQLWLHLMKYDKELNEKVSQDSGLQKEVLSYLAGKIEECKNIEAKRFISAFNAIAFMRTKLMFEMFRRKKIS